MATARKKSICLDKTPYYHIMTRCVRRAFLCGVDHRTGRNFDHRKDWIVDRIRLLSSVFTIDVLSYAVMSNHYHLVVHIDPKPVKQFSKQEVVERWHCLYKGDPLMHRWLRGDELRKKERSKAKKLIKRYRRRLTCISEFMRCLNEPLARRSNKEDDCSGHFWESRFKSQPLYDEAALLACMSYVDLNPVRAKLASTVETSAYTSIQQRINPTWQAGERWSEQLKNRDLHHFDLKLKPLMPFKDQRDGGVGNHGDEAVINCIDFEWDDYRDLVIQTAGLQEQGEEKQKVPRALPIITEQLQISVAHWRESSRHFEALYNRRFRAMHCRRPFGEGF